MRHEDLLTRGLSRSADKIAFIDEETSMTFREADIRAGKLAGALIAAGIKTGDRIAFVAQNSNRHIELHVATQRIGAIYVPLNWRLTAGELDTVVNDFAPSLLIYESAFEEAVADLAVPARWWFGVRPAAGDSYEERVSAGAEHAKSVVSPEAVSMLLYTSGTTGPAKGVMLTNAAHLARMMTLVHGLQMKSEDVFLQVLPMFHIAATFTDAFAWMGATNIILPRFDPDSTLAAIEKHGVTQTLFAPTIIAALVNGTALDGRDLRSVHSVNYGSSPITPSGLNRATDAIDAQFRQIYGLTETGASTFLSPEDHADVNTLQSAGLPAVLVDVDLIDDSGTSCLTDQNGEIVVSGPGMMAGYWGNPVATSEALIDGWFRTGDVGRRSDDGYISVIDRKKDIIISGGENVSASEVEATLAAHPRVAECAVIGVPDDYYVERVHAIIVLSDEVDGDMSEQLREFCRPLLAGYKCPRSYEFVQTLPRNALGKVLKHVLRKERRA